MWKCTCSRVVSSLYAYTKKDHKAARFLLLSPKGALMDSVFFFFFLAVISKTAIAWSFSRSDHENLHIYMGNTFPVSVYFWYIYSQYGIPLSSETNFLLVIIIDLDQNGWRFDWSIHLCSLATGYIITIILTFASHCSILTYMESWSLKQWPHLLVKSLFCHWLPFLGLPLQLW